MGFKNLISKTTELTGAATDAAGKIVKEFNEALPTMRSLGFTISDLRVGMGLIPEISAKLIASTDTIDVNKINEVIEKHPDNKTLVGVLNALQAAYNIKQEIGDLPLKGVEIAVKLGLPPHIGVGFVSGMPVAKVVAA